MTKDIVNFNFEKASGYDIPNKQNDRLDKRTITGIINAWNRNAIIDESGKIWIDIGTIHTVLRTSKDNAKYIIGGLPEKEKLKSGNRMFVKGTAICGLLDSSIQDARSISRENYIQWSQLLYLEIRDLSWNY